VDHESIETKVVLMRLKLEREDVAGITVGG
jgi:hypothetical protein